MAIAASAAGGYLASGHSTGDIQNMDSPSLAGALYKEGYAGNTATQKSSMQASSGLNLAPASDLEKQARGQIGSSFQDIMKMLNMGPGADSVGTATNDTQNFLDMMRQVNSNGGMPTAEDTRRANVFADQMFAPQQEAMNQQYVQSQQDAAKLAASLNRPINDPIIQARLQQEQMRQSNMFNANRSAFVAQEARNSPFQRMQLQGQLADTSNSLATQAMQNRMQLLNLGNSLQADERNWRLQTADKWGNQTGEQSQHSGGGIMGGIGALTGTVGSVMGAIGSVYSMGGAGTGAATNTKNSQAAATPAPQMATMSYAQQAQPNYQASPYQSYQAPYNIANPQMVPNQRNSRLFNPQAGGNAYWNFSNGGGQ